MANQQAFTKTTVLESSGTWAHDGFTWINKVPHGAVLEVADFAADYTDTDGRIMIPSGTLVGRTYAERDGDPTRGFGPADVTTDDQIYLTTEDIYDAKDNENHETGLYRHHRMVYENQLPRWESATNPFTPAEKDKIRELYECITSPD